ncbi:hypothetical protein LguiA_033047 [Lonicera macranthoides]
MQDALTVFVTICIASFAPIRGLAAVFDVRTYGAVGDGKKDDTQVLGNLVAPVSLYAWKRCEKNSWIVFSTVNNLIVYGSGQINGQGSFWWGKSLKSPTCSTPTALLFFNCHNMMLNGLYHLNPPRNHIGIDTCKGARISNLHITAPENSPNTDGIDIATSTHVQIRRLNIQTEKTTDHERAIAPLFD